LVMGDALAVSLLEARGFTRDDFAFSHPGGQIGRRLLLRVSDIMHTDLAIPSVNENTLVSGAILEMTTKKLGMTAIVNSENELLGIFTDGDLRRLLGNNLSVPNCEIRDVMTKNSKVIHADCLAAEAMQIMQQQKISALCVVDNQHKVCGALNMHDLIRAGIV
ncbi:MAG: CBS domain-containing protein, partial [Methylococcales bacterium]|nr:CBS domain-containing protein [Methylococcales bacterium]